MTAANANCCPVCESTPSAGVMVDCPGCGWDHVLTHLIWWPDLDPGAARCPAVLHSRIEQLVQAARGRMQAPDTHRLLALVAVAGQTAGWDTGRALRHAESVLSVLDIWERPADLVRHCSHFAAQTRLATTFIESLAPRPITALLHQPAVLKARLDCFRTRSTQDDAQIEREATDILRSRGCPDADEAAALIVVLGPRRLRTIPPDLLMDITRNYRLWHPLIDALAAPGNLTPEQEKVLGDLLARLKGKVAGLWGRQGAAVIEDAVQDVLTAVIASLRSPRPGYSYEGDFLTWLTAAALNRLRSQARRPREYPLPEGFDDHGEPAAGNGGDRNPGGPDPGDPAEALEQERDQAAILTEWRTRFRLVESFFKGEESRERVKALFESMLLYANEDLDHIEDVQVARYVSDRTGEAVNPTTLASTRRRLRQRLEVLRLLRDVVPTGAADAPGDFSVQAHVANRYGLADKDLPTLRAIAALARACGSGRSLEWAILARDLVTGNDCSVPPDADALGPAARARLERGLRPVITQTMRKLANSASTRGTAFLVAPCWLAVVLDGVDADAACARLKPDTAAEAAAIRHIIAEFKRQGLS